MIGVETALALLAERIAPLPEEAAPLARALNRVLAQPAAAACDLPLFDQSAVDGYAVRAADVAHAPVTLPLAGVVRAATQAAVTVLASGTAQRIFTGGLAPQGTDAIVRQELTEPRGDAVLVRAAVPAGADLRRQGEELRAGAPLAAAGTRVTPGLLAALAMAGVSVVRVRRAPRITVLVTGDEVVPPGGHLRLGQVHDANGPLVTHWLQSLGYAAVHLRYVPDTADAVSAALSAAWASSDLVITTGGVSVGDHDHVPAMAQALGAESLLWTVAQKPGKPLFVAMLKGVPLLGLPGNPASVFVNLVVYVRRALDRLENLGRPGPAFQTGCLTQVFKPDAQRDTWLRVTVETGPAGCVALGRLPKQGSHMLSNLAAAGGLAWIPAGSQELPAGSAVRWLSL